MFAEAELLRLLRRPEQAVLKFDAICEQFNPKDLGAALLAQCGDRLLERGMRKDAEKFYRALASGFPKSELLDYSYNGLGQIALPLIWLDSPNTTSSTTYKVQVTTNSGSQTACFNRTAADNQNDMAVTASQILVLEIAA